MEPTIEFNPSFSMLTLQLSPGEAVKAEPGAMAAQQGRGHEDGDERRAVWWV